MAVFQNLFDLYCKEILQSRLLMVEGKLQREGEVVHVIVQRCFDLTKLLRQLTPAEKENLPILTLSRADETSIPVHVQNKKGQEMVQREIFAKGRNFR